MMCFVKEAPHPHDHTQGMRLNALKPDLGVKAHILETVFKGWVHICIYQ